MRRFAADYAYRFDDLAPFFAGNPALPDAWTSVIDRTTAHPRDREAMASLIEAQQRRREAPAAGDRGHCPASAIRAAWPSSRASRPDVFGGPLYTLLKALTAIRVAAEVAREHGVPTVAVFWIDSEDHDWEEVASTTVLDAEFAPRSFTLPAPAGAGHVPVAHLRLDDSITRSRSTRCGATLPPTEFTDELLEQSLAVAYAPGTRRLRRLRPLAGNRLGPLGLVVYDCADPAAKPLVADVFARGAAAPRPDLRAGGRGRRGAGAAGLSTRRWRPTSTPTALFHLADGRQAHQDLEPTGSSSADRSVAADALVDGSRGPPRAVQPERAAAAARPGHALPDGRLRLRAERTGVPGPTAWGVRGLRHPDAARGAARARHAARPRRRRGSWRGTPCRSTALQARDESTLNRLLEAQLPPSVEAAFQDAQQCRRRRRCPRWSPAVGLIDPTLEGAAKSTLGKLEHELRTLHGKMIHAAKKRDETLRRQFMRARALAFPDGHLQERTLGFVYFLNRYGPSLIDVLATELPDDRGHHWLLTL